MNKTLGIYIHVPFCARKCNYCDFLSFPADDESREKYVAALIAQIKGYSNLVGQYETATVYFGGGTPSVLSVDQTERIVDALKEFYHLDFSGGDLEFTTEVNPGTVDIEKLKAYRKMGMNRLSIGVQSANDRELQTLGRIHTFNEASECVKNAKKAGFTNISMDLISALPGQTLEDYKASVEKILALEPTHISSYSLIVEEGTPFFEKYGPNGSEKESLPDEDSERAMYYATRDMLMEKGYHRYEISNYSLPGYESKHNSSYWKGVDYLGLGLGAASLLGNVRYRNTESLEEFLQTPMAREIDEILDIKALEAEYMILGLRRVKGVSMPLFWEKFQKDIFEVYGKEIEECMKDGLLIQDEERLRLTDKGLDLSNYVMERFI